MNMTITIERKEVYNPIKKKMVKKPTFLTVDIVCKNKAEMDVVRDMYMKEVSKREDEFKNPCEKGFASCYCGEEKNWDALSIPYDIHTVKNDREVFMKIWKNVKKDYESA